VKFKKGQLEISIYRSIKLLPELLPKEAFSKTRDVCLSATAALMETLLVSLIERYCVYVDINLLFSGMNFEMDSQPSSKGFSSSWANKLPRLMKRRGAFPKFDSESTNPRRNSVESDIGISFRK